MQAIIPGIVASMILPGLVQDPVQILKQSKQQLLRCIKQATQIKQQMHDREGLTEVQAARTGIWLSRGNCPLPLGHCGGYGI